MCGPDLRPPRALAFPEHVAANVCAKPLLKRDVSPIGHSQLNDLLKKKLGPRFEIAVHSPTQEGRFSSHALGIDGKKYDAQFAQPQPHVAATSSKQTVILTKNEVADHGAFPSTEVKAGERLIDKNELIHLPPLQAFPFLKTERADRLVQSILAAAQASPRLANKLQALGNGPNKIVLSTSGRPYQAQELDKGYPAIYVNGEVDVEPTFVPSGTGIGGHFTVTPKPKNGVTLYLPHNDSGYSPASIEYAVNLLAQALSGQAINPKAAARGVRDAHGLNKPQGKAQAN